MRLIAGKPGAGVGRFLLGLMLLVAVSVSSGVAIAAETPVVTIDPTVTAGYTTASISGTVDARGEEARVYAEYATSEAGPFKFQNIATIPAGTSGTTAVAGEVTGLEPGTTYYFRLDAEVSGVGETYSPPPDPTATTKVVARPTATIETPSLVTPTTAHFAGQVNPDAPGPAPQNSAFDTSWQFRCSPACPGLDEPVISADNSAHAVTQDATELQPNTAYEVFLFAKNAGGSIESNPETFTTTKAKPAVRTVFAESVGVTDATLSATVDTENDATSYHFVYGPTPSYGSTTPESAPLLANPRFQQGSATITGLVPGTLYHWRVVATNSAGTTEGPDRTFVTFSAGSSSPGGGCPNEVQRLGFSTGLPDCRAYEQASPVDKNGNSVQGSPNIVEAAAHGARVTFYVGGAIPGGDSATDLPTYMSSRTGGTWITTGILPPRSTGPRGAVKGWSEELNQVYSSNFLLAAPITGTLYETDTETGGLRTLATGLPGLEPFYIGSSTDGTAVAFEEPFQAEPSESVWSEADGQVHLASVLNDGSLPPEGAVAGPYNWFNDPNGFNGGVQGTYYVRAEHALSDNGARLYFTGIASHAVYARTNPTAPQSALVGSQCTEVAKACTAEVSAGEPAAFIGATPDGSSALILSSAALTGDATTGPSQEGVDLYRYDASSGEVTDLTIDENSSDPNGAEVVGVLGYSRDMSYVYFVANGVLGNGTGGTRGDCELKGDSPGPSQCNLYVWHDGSVALVGRLEAGVASGDEINWKPVSGVSETQPAGQVSPDGKSVLFSSVIDQRTGLAGTYAELYRYSIDTAEAVCVSCSSSGAEPQGSASVTAQVPPNVPPRAPAPVLKRNLVDGGNRVFFDSPDRLIGADHNEVNDVYEWEASGVGTCLSTTTPGCISLISSGTSALPSYFADSDEAGENVFFFTSQQLVAADGDELVDVYDARENGGIASQNASPLTPCLGEACKREAEASASILEPGSSTFTGPENKKHHKKKHHKKKHHKKKHHHGRGQKKKTDNAKKKGGKN